MSDERAELADAVDRFLEDADAAFDQYDQGYADADATVSLLERHVADLRDVIDE